MTEGQWVAADGAALRAARDAADLSQTEAARRIGVSRVTLNRWEQAIQVPNSADLERARALYEKEARPDADVRANAARASADLRRRFDEAVATIRSGLRELEAIANTGAIGEAAAAPPPLPPVHSPTELAGGIRAGMAAIAMIEEDRRRRESQQPQPDEPSRPQRRATG